MTSRANGITAYQEQNRAKGWLWWIVIGLVAILLVAWRSDWVVTGGAARIENPYGWR
jgi:hypothetical protein